MTGLNGFQNFRMRKIDARVVAGLVLVVERKGLADLELFRAVLELADAQLGSLQVAQNADRTARALLDRADALDQRAHELVARMAHIDTEKVRTGLVELLDHVLFGRGGTERGKNLDLAKSFHQF